MKQRWKSSVAILLILTLLLSTGSLSTAATALGDGNGIGFGSDGNGFNDATPSGAAATPSGTDAADGEDGQPEEEPQKIREQNLITDWKWMEEAGLLSEEEGRWSLPLPGASAENPAYPEDIIALLPERISATVEPAQTASDSDAEETLEMDIAIDEAVALAGWTALDFPEEGSYEGSYVFAAELPDGYALSADARALEVDVRLGGANVLPVEGVCSVDGRNYENGFCPECGQYEPAVYHETENRYEISNAGQLYWFAALVNGDGEHAEFTEKNIAANGILMNDITVNEGEITGESNADSLRAWKPIGTNEEGKWYQGTFDGNDKTISGLYFNDSTSWYIGLFGNVRAGKVSGVSLTNSYMCGYGDVGGICGYSSSGTTIEDCYNEAEIYGGSNVGGICGGGQDGGNIIGCTNSGSIKCESGNIGGVLGFIDRSGVWVIKDCINEGSINGGSSYDAGGICGNTGERVISVSITGCCNTGEVRSGTDHVGGIVGNANNVTVISQCWNSAAVSGNGYVGGIAGLHYGNVEKCWNTGDVTGTGGRMGGIAGENWGKIIFSYNTGTVITNNWGAGGICGTSTGGTTVESCYNTGIVTGNTSGSISGLFNGNAIRCYYLEMEDAKDFGELDSRATLTSTDSKTATQFQWGDVTWCLNAGVTDGSQVWYQNLDNGQTADEIPMYNDGTNVRGTVYQGSTCLRYSNAEYLGERGHEYEEDGFCPCGRYQPAENVDGKYQISNAGQLFWFAALVNNDNTYADFENPDSSASGLLVQDVIINVGNLEQLAVLGRVHAWIPAGSSGQPYGGTFDGAGHTISGLYYKSDSQDDVGLFGYMGSSGKITGLTLSDGLLSGSGHVGAICGTNQGTIEGCVNAGAVISGGSGSGGICGINEGSISGCSNTSSTLHGGTGGDLGGICGKNKETGSLADCSNSGDVHGEGPIGGICGGNSGSIANCENSGRITPSGYPDYVGGICGSGGYGTINRCSNKGTINAGAMKPGNDGYYQHIGGILGNGYGIVTNSYNTGVVQGGGQVGGIVGSWNSSNALTSCYNTGKVTGSDSHVGAICGVASGSGTISNNYYLDISVGDGLGAIGSGTVSEAPVPKTEQQFAGGDVAYALNGGETEGNLVWYQNLDNEEPLDEAPRFVGGIVYKISETLYSNHQNMDFYSVDIVWEPMAFTYTDGSQGKWNPDRHQYEEATQGGWSPDSPDGGKIAVKNKGNTSVFVNCQYEIDTVNLAVKDIQGSFLYTDGQPVQEDTLLACEEQIDVCLQLSGEPTANLSTTKLGTVIVTISTEQQGGE